MTRTLLRQAILVLLVAAGLNAAAAAQSDYGMPEALLPFWDDYKAARAEDDEKAMDGAARRQSNLADRTLNYLIERFCLSTSEDYELEGELRQLGWSLDRVLGGEEKYIERVRLVVNLDVPARRRRVVAMNQFFEGIAKFREARFSRDAAGLAAAEKLFLGAGRALRELPDREYSIYCFYNLGEIARLQEHFDDAEGHYKTVVEIGADLAYTEPLVDTSEGYLSDIDRMRTGEPDVSGGAGADGGGEAGGAAGGGGGLNSFAEGSTDQQFELAYVIPKRGMPTTDLPTFSPPDQYFNWAFTTIENEGPVEFDTMRGRFTPFGKSVLLTRDGTDFAIDSDGDGEADVEFAPTSQPTRIDIPNAEGGDPYALMVAIPSDREIQFGVEVNYSPQMNFAYLRFHIGGYLEGKVLGQTWRLFDTNLTGNYGDVWGSYAEHVTSTGESDEMNFYEADAVHIGKAKKARPWSSVLDIDGTFYRTALEANGTQLKLREMDVETGFIKLDMDSAVAPNYLLVRETGELFDAVFDVVPAKRNGVVEVPVGTYQVCFGRLQQGKKTSMKIVRVYEGDAQPFAVTAGETHVLELGAPYRVTFNAPFHADDETVLDTRSMRVFGRGGEEYAMFYDTPLQPTVEVRTVAGKKLAKAQKTRTAGIEEWQNNTGQDNVLWFPVEYRVENPRQEELQFRIEQGSHKILGGPFDSGWSPEVAPESAR